MVCEEEGGHMRMEEVASNARRKEGHVRRKDGHVDGRSGCGRGARE